MNEIQIVIGSWGSYNECNEKALGSKWLNLADYEDWSEIEKELTKEGFKLKGIDEELFIQDIEGFNTDGLNCDYTHPKYLFELLKESGVLDDDYKYELMQAYLDVRNFDDFELDTNIEDKDANEYWWNYTCQSNYYLHTFIDLKIMEVN